MCIFWKILLLLVVFNCISIPLSASVIISEDFSKFVLGSEDAPDLQNPVATESSPISSDLTNTPGWSGTLVYQAGGCAYIQMMGMLMPPVFDASNNEGNYTVKFRARSQDGSDCYVVVAGYGAYDGVTETVGSEWSDHSVLMSGRHRHTSVINKYIIIYGSRLRHGNSDPLYSELKKNNKIW